MLDFILSNLYIVIIAGFAIFTAISSRSGKGKAQRRNPNGMPTFGGGPMDRNKDKQPEGASGDSADEAQRRYREAQQRYEAPQTYEEGRSYETNRESSEGSPTRSFERNEQEERQRGGSTRSIDQHNDELQKRLDQLNRNLDKRATDNNSRTAERASTLRFSPEDPSYAEHIETPSADSILDAEQARQGIIWAEILGPPRSRQSQGKIATSYKK